MSIMRCSKCETMVDTDKDTFYFDVDLCDDCVDLALDLCFKCKFNCVMSRLFVNGVCPEFKLPFSLIRLLKSIAAGIWATFK